MSTAIAENSQSPRCPYCGYSRRGLGSEACPECGTLCPAFFRCIPGDALLPWETRIDTPQVWRFLRTMARASSHYIRYLGNLRRHRGIPPYQGRSLIVWIACSAIVMPFVIFLAVDPVLGSVFRHGVSARWLNMGLPVAFRVALSHSWTLLIPYATTLIAELFFVAGIVTLTSSLSARRRSYVVSLCAVGPPVLVLRTVQLGAACLLAQVAITQGRDLGGAEMRVMDCATLLGVSVCCCLALRIIWCVRRGAATVAALVTGVTLWRLGAFVWLM